MLLIRCLQTKRMEGETRARDRRTGLHVNTHDTDCAHCKCDLFLSAVVSSEAPGVAVCPEHAADLGCPPETCTLLYRQAAAACAARFPVNVDVG